MQRAYCFDGLLPANGSIFSKTADDLGIPQRTNGSGLRLKEKFGGRRETIIENVAVRSSYAGIAYLSAHGCTSAESAVETNAAIKSAERLGHRNGKPQLDGEQFRCFK